MKKFYRVLGWMWLVLSALNFITFCVTGDFDNFHIAFLQSIIAGHDLDYGYGS